MDITYVPIGVIHSPFQTPEDMPIQPAGAKGVEGFVEIFEPYGKGLQDIDGFSHIMLLYHFHRSSGYDLTVTPFLDDQPHGLFATRAPRRPNPIGLSIVRLLSRNGCRLLIDGVDILDGTPLLDIKPYSPEFDSPGSVKIGWMETKRGQAGKRKSDGRFNQ